MPVSGEAEVRAVVRRAWNEAMPGVALDETLTWQDAGVDSLKSLQLLLTVEKALERPISFDLFTRETRIGDLIAILAQGGAAPAAGARRRAYLAPGMFGDEPALAELRAGVRDFVAFETLQLPDLASPVGLTADMDATAACLADQILQSSAGGPIILAGFSFGAHAALATALALQSRGVAVDMLCLFDPLPGPLPAWHVAPSLWARLRKRGLSLSGAATVLVRGLASLGWVAGARRLALATAAWPEVDDAEKRRRHVLVRLRGFALKAWRPSVFQGPTLLFASVDFERTGDPGPYLGLLPNVAIVRVPSDHLHMFEGAALQTIVETLGAGFAEPPASQPASVASSASRSGL